MSAEANKRVVRRFIEELWNARRLQVADDLFAPDCITHQLQSGQPETTAPRSPEHVKEHVAGWLAAFPDLRMTVEHMLAEGDLVFTSIVLEGTHQGTWAGVPPTAKKASVRLMVVHRIGDGKIREDWVLVESLGFLQQLSIAPPTSEMMEKASRR